MASHGSALLPALARAGYAARGLVYLVVGYLAGRAAWSGTRPEGAKGALQELWSGPLGRILLIVIGVGLLLFAAWRLLQSLLDQDNHGSGARALAIRAGLLASAATYAFLALFALGFLGGGGDSGSSKAAAFLLSQPFGRTILGLFAAVVFGVGLAHLWKSYRRLYLERLQMPDEIARWASPISRFGLSMRGITFLILGGFLLVSAWRGQADKAAGLGEALRSIQQLSFGWVLLAVIAVGLASFGLHSLIEAIWRRMATAPGGAG